jgi:nicotinamidase-related amidase
MGCGEPVADALVVVDVLGDFRHEDGERLARSFAAVAPRLAEALAAARAAGTPVVYVNDARGHWDGDRQALVERALAGRAPEAVAAVAPQPGDRLLYKPRYSAFDATPLSLVLQELDVDRLVLAGTATEMCVAQTAIQAREHGFAVTVLRDACANIEVADADIALAYLARVTGSSVVRTADWVAETWTDGRQERGAPAREHAARATRASSAAAPARASGSEPGPDDAASTARAPSS